MAIVRKFSFDVDLTPEEMACSLIALVPRNAERTVALRKLLEAKDAAVRANVG